MLRWLDMIAAQQPLRRVALDVGMHAAAGMVNFLPQMKERLATSTLIEDVEYARHGDVTLWLDILQPQGPGPHSVLVYLHGGAFAIGSKRTHRALAAAYASRGYWCAILTIGWHHNFRFLQHLRMPAPPGCGPQTILVTMGAISR